MPAIAADASPSSASKAEVGAAWRCWSLRGWWALVFRGQIQQNWQNTRGYTWENWVYLGNTRYFADFSDFCQILPQKSW